MPRTELSLLWTTFFGLLIGSRSCPNCTELSPQFSQGKTLFLAKEVGRSLIHELKYAQGIYVLKDIEVLLKTSAYWRTYFTDTILVPVPLYASKLRQRGYNQSEKIANCISKCFPKLTEIQMPLIRVTDTETQKPSSIENKGDKI